MRRAAFFDLDGTLVTENSALLWVQRERRLGRLTTLQLLRAMAFFAGYRLSLVGIDAALESALQTLRGSEEATLRQAIQDWYAEEVAPLAAPGAFSTIAAHRERGDLLVVLTSSSLYAAEEACRQFALEEIICTRYDVRDGLFTGSAPRPYCYGRGKVLLAEDFAEERSIDLAGSAFYTDSLTDLPMLLRVGQPHVVNPDPRLRREARRRGWPILDWRSAT
jgi:HAD superfamily hydrolase (TIGR01490 family)